MNNSEDLTIDKQIDSVESYQAAVKMFHREHDRWNQWALFFFGSVSAIFLLSGQLTEIPKFLFCLAAAFVSLAWVIAGQNIRASTGSWRGVIMDLEKGEKVKVFIRYKKLCDEYPRRKDFCETLCLCKEGPNSTLRSVSRMLILMGFFSFICFLGLSIAYFVIMVRGA